MRTPESFEKYADTLQSRISRELTETARERLTILAARFPKRRFFYRSAMMVCGTEVEVFSEGWINKPSRYPLRTQDNQHVMAVGIDDMCSESQMGCYGDLFKEFAELDAWIADMEQTYQATCDDIDIPAAKARCSGGKR